jgi:hypothetical protein
MEPEGSLHCSQDSATGLYPEPDASVQTFPIHFPEMHSNIIITRDENIKDKIPGKSVNTHILACKLLEMKTVPLVLLSDYLH